jgi:deoxyribose-phosphate aldolase
LKGFEFMTINKFIDHTYLKAFGTTKEITTLLEEAKEYDFKSVCVNPTWVAMAATALANTDVLVCTVIGFPLGANTTETKVFETTDAIQKGADEIDMVVNVGKVKEGDYSYIENEVRAIKEACGSRTLKVILETCYLEKDEIKQASEACYRANADFVKTSTGFGTGGALVEDVKIMKSVYKDREVKASGGVRSIEDVKAMVEAGATRIGTSSGVKLMQGQVSDTDY